MYSKIQELKAQGFSMRQVARIIRVSRNTISKYWVMPPEEYAATYRCVHRMSVLSAYEAVITKWLEAYPCMTAAQVRDWLQERHHVDAAERTVRRYVAQLREKTGLTKQAEPQREYEAVEEMPKGYQLQLDFGEKKVRSVSSNHYHKLYFVVYTLSHSRYKWGVFKDRPFTSGDLVRSLYECFEHFGGMPRQLVYDQDSIIVVSENSGDIIHTQAFETFLAETKCETRVCRKSDPESKGLVEASVKFVKRNFMEHRLYTSLELWNHAFEDWLVRTGNGKVHGTTKKKPREMFAEEQEHLRPLFGKPPSKTVEGKLRQVRADNTVLYLSNRYSVPFGTYSRGKNVYLNEDGDMLRITDAFGETVAMHHICKEKGRLIKLESHRRVRRTSPAMHLEKAVAVLGEEFRPFLSYLCQQKPRYIVEQLRLVHKICEEYGRECVLDALETCQQLGLTTASDLKDAAQTLSATRTIVPSPERLPVKDERYHIAVQQRSLAIYTGIAAGNEVRK